MIDPNWLDPLGAIIDFLRNIFICGKWIAPSSLAQLVTLNYIQKTRGDKENKS